LSTISLVQLEDRAKLSEDLKALNRRVYELDEDIRDAIYRHRYSTNPEETARGADDLWHLVSELDRLMTVIRGVEAKLLLLQKTADRVAVDQRESREQTAATCIGAENVSARVAVEVHRDPHPARITG
jgi:hypothetical protein